MEHGNTSSKRPRCTQERSSSGGAAAGAKSESVPGGRRERTDPWGNNNGGADDGRPWANNRGPDAGRPPVIVTALPAEAQGGQAPSRGARPRVATSAAAAASLSAARRLASARPQPSSWRSHPGGTRGGAPVSSGQSPAVSCDGRGGGSHASSASSASSAAPSSSPSSCSSSAIAAREPQSQQEPQQQQQQQQQQQRQRQHQHQHQTTAPVEVSPGDDDDDGDGAHNGRVRARDHDSGGCGDGSGGGAYSLVIAPRPPALGRQPGTAAESNGGSANRGGRGSEHRPEHEPGQENEEEGKSGSGSSFPYLLCGRPCPLATLEDLPDTALARAFFSGFLDSLEIILSLRLVSRRMMDVGSDACQVMDLHRTPIRDQDLRKVAAAFPQVVHVDLSFCKSLRGGVSESLRSCASTLQTLSLRGAGASAAVVQGLGCFRQLTTLDLSQSMSMDARKITAASLIEGLPQLVRLEKLSLAWNKGVTDDVIERLCTEVRGLRELDLGLCSNITVRSIEALSVQTKLRALSLRACINIADDAVEMLTVACPGLASLDLAHLPGLTAKSLRSLVFMRSLKKLDLRCCERLTTADVVNFRVARPSTRVAELKAWWP